MSQFITTRDANHSFAQGTVLSGPPEERFWKRYSPHHELPLSGATSLLLHGLGGALLFLGALGLAAPRGHGLEIGTPFEVRNAPGGEGPGTGTDSDTPPKPGDENAQKPQVADVPKPPDETPLDQPKLPPVQFAKPDSQPGRPLLAQIDPTRQELNEIGKKAAAYIERSREGGENSGKPGGDSKPGSRGKLMTEQERRQLRWTLMFDTQDGSDYLRQLHDLSAVLAIPQTNGEHVVIRDLGKPEQRKVESLADFQEIYWIDDKPASVGQLSRALGLPSAPECVVAFFPSQFQKDLLAREIAYLRKTRANGTERDIHETVFRLERHGTRYEPIVVRQVLN